MAISELDLELAENRMHALRADGYALSARYDRRSARVVIELNTGIQVAVPISRIEGLSDGTAGDLSIIEISPAGLGLHWPRLDADIYLPALLNGIFGSRQWMAAQLGQQGGRATSSAKAMAARENGRKGGRPRKVASA